MLFLYLYYIKSLIYSACQVLQNNFLKIKSKNKSDLNLYKLMNILVTI